MTDRSAQTVASRALGQICWRAERGHGSFLTFDFGRRVSGPEQGRGEWHLWVYFGDWVLRHGDAVLASCWDDYGVIDRAMEQFAGRRLDEVDIDPDSLEAVFRFEDGLDVQVGPNSDAESSDSDWWLLFTPDERVLVVRPGPSWTYEPSGEP